MWYHIVVHYYGTIYLWPLIVSRMATGRKLLFLIASLVSTSFYTTIVQMQKPVWHHVASLWTTANVIFYWLLEHRDVQSLTAVLYYLVVQYFSFFYTSFKKFEISGVGSAALAARRCFGDPALCPLARRHLAAELRPHFFSPRQLTRLTVANSTFALLQAVSVSQKRSNNLSPSSRCQGGSSYFRRTTRRRRRSGSKHSSFFFSITAQMKKKT